MWVRVDPEYCWLRTVHLKQELFMWVFQARLDRNIASQIEVWRIQLIDFRLSVFLISA